MFSVKTQVSNFSLKLLLFKIILSVLHKSTAHTIKKILERDFITKALVFHLYSTEFAAYVEAINI